MYSKSEAYGIFQGDIIIRTAIVAAINDLRANPWALEYVFSSLTHDELTEKTYGQKEIDKAINWFLSTDIPIVNSLRVDNIRLPCISVALQESTEVENTLADKNYDTSEIYQDVYPILFGPFSCGYDPATGEMILPVEVFDRVVPHQGMMIEDAKKNRFTMLEVEGNKIVLGPNLLIDTTSMYIRSQFPQRVQLEAANFRESYVIGCHSRGEPYECLYLHSIVLFAMLRYRQKYLEARGFGRSAVSSTDIRVNDQFDAEIVFSRFITLSGFTRQFWPKDIGSAIESVLVKDTSRNVSNAVVVEENAWGWGATAKEGIKIEFVEE